MNWKLSKIFFFCLLLTSCANLQQAPLIYSSKSSVGLDISSSTTESPGGSISFGVKLVDAAYVPVAVSKRVSNGNEHDTNNRIEMIQAIFGKGITQGGLEGLTEDNKRKIRAYLEAQQKENKIAEELSKKVNEKTGLEESIKSARQQVSELQAEIASAAADANSSAQNNQLDELGKKIIAELQQLKTVEAAVIALNAQQKDAADTSSRLFNKAAEAAAFLQTEKQDAMSVYGRFDSNGSAGIESMTGGLTAGKIFSTGVASQNLTEAARYSAIYTSVANCVSQMTAAYIVASVDDKSKVLATMEKFCDPESLRKLEPDK